eukprot:CAMPEP_0183391846 /NCGR_PEP_ID=MMETSP0370-20130417/6708_1 /TAXON_ID=268820 /ORGANISM="Peridinium aciculiferum, Strain PAER-2" /LENGTH=35 /DNA_ID= /DNA_START= /DNA_END= /DNA_ORIENTATION=
MTMMTALTERVPGQAPLPERNSIMAAEPVVAAKEL